NVTLFADGIYCCPGIYFPRRASAPLSRDWRWLHLGRRAVGHAAQARASWFRSRPFESRALSCRACPTLELVVIGTGTNGSLARLAPMDMLSSFAYNLLIAEQVSLSKDPGRLIGRLNDLSKDKF